MEGLVSKLQVARLFLEEDTVENVAVEQAQNLIKSHLKQIFNIELYSKYFYSYLKSFQSQEQ